jgi:general stress protein YciG
MAGTKAGGIAARDTNLKKDPDFYRKIGRMGGENRPPGPFAHDRELARRAGRKGGLNRRGYRKHPKENVV